MFFSAAQPMTGEQTISRTISTTEADHHEENLDVDTRTDAG